MNIIPSIDNITANTEKDYTTITINESLSVKYKNTADSNNDILSDLLESKAYATALLYLNENYALVKENDLDIDKYLKECEDLLYKNIKIVDEVGIPLTNIKGYKIYETENGILRGNGRRKIFESFDTSIVDWVNNNGYDKDNNKCNNEADAIEFITNLDDNDPRKKEARSKFKDYSFNKEIDEDGTQTADIASKVDQGETTPAKPKKKYYDLLLSDINEDIDNNICNKGFMKNLQGQYQRGNYILVKEGDKYFAVNKNRLKEENINGKIETK